MIRTDREFFLKKKVFLCSQADKMAIESVFVKYGGKEYEQRISCESEAWQRLAGRN